MIKERLKWWLQFHHIIPELPAPASFLPAVEISGKLLRKSRG
jgi:hypothetical protein